MVAQASPLARSSQRASEDARATLRVFPCAMQPGSSGTSRRMHRLRCSRRSRRLFFPVAVASRFFLNSGCFAKSGTANGDSAFMQRVKHPQLLDNRSSRESPAQSAFAFSNLLPIETHGGGPASSSSVSTTARNGGTSLSMVCQTRS